MMSRPARALRAATWLSLCGPVQSSQTWARREWEVATINSQAEIIRGNTGSPGQSVIIVGLAGSFTNHNRSCLLSSTRPTVSPFMNCQSNQTRFSQRKPIMIWSILTNKCTSCVLPPLRFGETLRQTGRDNRNISYSLVLFLTDVSKHTNCITPQDAVEWQNYIFILCKTKLEKSGQVYGLLFECAN